MPPHETTRQGTSKGLQPAHTAQNQTATVTAEPAKIFARTFISPAKIGLSKQNTGNHIEDEVPDENSRVLEQAVTLCVLT